MNREEFKQKMNEIKRQMQEILWGIERHDAYIYQKSGFQNFYYQIKDFISRINYILDNFESRNTSETFHKSVYEEFSKYLKFSIDKWNRVKDWKWINGKVYDKHGDEKDANDNCLR